MLNAIKIMEPKALDTQRFYTLGAAKLIRCYVLITLVDLYGDIPYTEILQGNQNLTPKFDNSAFVYKKIFQEIDEAVILLKKAGSKESNRLKVGNVSWDQIRTVAEGKMPDLNCFTIESAMSMVAGTARSMGITVTGENPFAK